MAKNRIKRRVVICGETHWVTGATEQQYAENLFKVMNDNHPAQSNMHDFRQYAESWFEVFSKPNVAPTTAIIYERQLVNTIYPAFAGRCIEEILPTDVQRMFNSMDVGERQMAKASKQKVKTVLNMIFEQAIEDGLIGKNPLKSKSIRITGRPSEETRPYSVEQMQYIAAHIGDIKSPRDRNYLALQALHPLRLEEVLGLRAMDIDLTKDEIHVRNTIRYNKFRKKEKT